MQAQTLFTDLTGVAPVIATDTDDRALATRTMNAVRVAFAEWDLSPTADMWKALHAVAETLQAMADGTAQQTIFLSSLDPGVGKTTTYVMFLRALLDDPRYEHVSAIVCVSRKDQIEAVVAEANLHPDDYAIFTADKAINHGEPSTARVLFTTQKMVESRCRRGTVAFEAAGDFHYLGMPRAVRIWDEAILPGRPVTITLDDITAVWVALKPTHPELAADLKALCRRVEDGTDETVVLPDLVETYGLTEEQAARLAKAEGWPDAVQDATQRLWELSGMVVTVRRDVGRDTVVLDYVDTLPDIAPLLVLDASIRVRGTYELWGERGGGITKLPEAVKSYSNLTIHHWSHGGGKHTYRDEKGSQELIVGVRSVIMTKPDEEWLVVHHKPWAGMIDLEREASRVLPDDVKGRVHYLTWGQHDATNSFRHVPNVILAGTLFYPDAHYEALGRTAARQHSADGRFAEDDIRTVKDGEHQHLILQAACRGAVRKPIGGGCPRTNLYIIAASNTGIAHKLHKTFPDARIKKWRPVQTALRKEGKREQSLRYLDQRFEQDPDAGVTSVEIMEAVGWPDRRSLFYRKVLNDDAFQDALVERGIIQVKGRGRKPTVFHKLRFPVLEAA